MLETLDHTIRIGSTPTFLYFDLYLYSAYAAHYVYNYYALVAHMVILCPTITLCLIDKQIAFLRDAQ